MLFYNTSLKKRSQKLRSNMTDAERMLWAKIRRKQLKGLQIYRQRIIGNYITDFYCPKAKLVIEVDGGQHYSKKGINRDINRDNYLKSNGIRVLRFSDLEVLKNIDGVIDCICSSL